MDKSKRIIKDVALFAIASFVPKVLGFFLVPLYTSCLSTEAFGTADLLNTIYTLLLPILTLDVSDAIMIYTIENRDDVNQSEAPMNIGVRMLYMTALGLLVAISGVLIFNGKENMYVYCMYIFMQYINYALYNNYLAYLRGKDRVNVIVVGSLILSMGTIIASFFFILVFKGGLYGLLLGNVIGPLAANVYFILKVGEKRAIFSIHSNLNKALFAKMIRYSAPLIFTGIAWWVNSSSDRVFISLLAGVSYNGIYAVANKLPTVLSAVHSVIYQALQLSVYAEIYADNDKSFLNALYNTYNSVMVIVASTLILLDIPLSGLLFKGSFFVAWKYVPPLLISTVLFSVSGYVTTIAAASKNTKLIAKATISGALLNTILNIILIPGLRIYGAVIATVAGYFVIWIIIVFETQRQNNIHFDITRSIVMYGLLLVQWVVVLKLYRSMFINAIILMIIIIINREELSRTVGVLKSTLLQQISSRR